MRLLKKVAKRGLRLLRSQSPLPNTRAYQQWVSADGDKTHRLFYDLNADSLVLDVGGYEGQWASDIFAMYMCSVHIFEPVPEFADHIKLRFARNTQIQVHPFGLGSKDEVNKIAVQSNASSIFAKNPSTEIHLVKARSFLDEHHIHTIDLMKINIEGGEYDLLDHLIDSELVLQIRDIQVQFHTFVPGYRERTKIIQEKLAKTHKLTYQYEFVWENWHLQSISPNNR